MKSFLLLAAASLLLGGDMHRDVVKAVATFKEKDPGMQRFFDRSVGYTVFPTITKGAAGVGAAHGEGEVYEGGTVIGTAKMTQVTIGAQLGGQQYSEIIFFETKDALGSFKNSDFKFAAQVSAVAAAEGASQNAKYENGVAVFTVTKGGLMYEASVGGQKFSYTPAP